MERVMVIDSRFERKGREGEGGGMLALCFGVVGDHAIDRLLKRTRPVLLTCCSRRRWETQGKVKEKYIQYILQYYKVYVQGLTIHNLITIEMFYSN